MSEYLERLAAARGRVSPRWTLARERGLRFKVERSLERRRRAVRVLGGVAVVVAALFAGQAGLKLWVGQTHVATQPVVRPTAPKLLELTDGSEVSALSADARLEPVEIGANTVRVRLEAGAARFAVRHREDRAFQVEARGVVVSVLGTAFTVQIEAGGVRVAVEQGLVDVLCELGHRKLGAGESLIARPPLAALPAAQLGSSEAVAAAPVEGLTVLEPLTEPEPAPVGNAPAPRAAVPTQPSWRALAQEGDYRGAFERMTGDGTAAVRDEPGDLLFAADVARLSGHPALAVPKLERVLKAYASDSRAPLAAFTLGRTLLDSLGRPREAAEAFARARRLAPSGALAQDALAREVESWSRAGESALAHERALEYLRKYPGGRREKAVRYHGGLE